MSSKTTIQRLTETIADVGVSCLSDTVVLMRCFELNGEIRHVISVSKLRVGLHELTLRELTLGSRGIELGSPLVGDRVTNNRCAKNPQYCIEVK